MRSVPMQVGPALDMPPQSAASAAAFRSASSSTMSASLPPASISTGVRLSAHAAMIFLPVAVDPVNATLLTRDFDNAAPVSPSPVTTWKTGWSGHTWLLAWASQAPPAGVYSLGVKTPALPAASAYAMEPIGGVCARRWQRGC